MKLKLIKETVGSYLDINFNDKKIIKSRRREYVEARMLYFYISKDLTKCSLSKLGATLKPNKDHATVLNNINKSKDLIKYNKEFKRKYDDLRYVVDHTLNKSIHINLNYEQLQLYVLNLKKEIDVFLEEKRKWELDRELLKEKLKEHKRYLIEHGHNANACKIFQILS